MDIESASKEIGETPVDWFGKGGTLRGALASYFEPDYPTRKEIADVEAYVDGLLRKIAERVLQNTKSQ